jgi:hypothetical protein
MCARWVLTVASVKYSRAGDLSVGEASVGETAWDWVRIRQLTACNT